MDKRRGFVRHAGLATLACVGGFGRAALNETLSLPTTCVPLPLSSGRAN